MATTTVAPARPTATTDAVRRQIQGQRADVTGVVFQGLLLLALLITMLALLALLYDVVTGALPVLTERPWAFLTQGTSSNPDVAGIGQGIRGTLLIGLSVVVLAFPLGIGAAIYLEEYAGDTRFSRFVSLNIRNLAGVPSVVYGLLGLAIFVGTLGPITGGSTVIAAGITLAVLVLPIVIITSAEALRAVPDSIREAGFGVGASRWEVVKSHVLPYAAPGILTGTVLSLARALGEAAPLILVGAISGFFANPADESFLGSLQGPFTALPMQVFSFARQPDPSLRELTSAAIVVLLGIVLVANAAAIMLRNRYEKRR